MAFATVSARLAVSPCCTTLCSRFRLVWSETPSHPLTPFFAPRCDQIASVLFSGRGWSGRNARGEPDGAGRTPLRRRGGIRARLQPAPRLCRGRFVSCVHNGRMPRCLHRPALHEASLLMLISLRRDIAVHHIKRAFSRALRRGGGRFPAPCSKPGLSTVLRGESDKKKKNPRFVNVNLTLSPLYAPRLRFLCCRPGFDDFLRRLGSCGLRYSLRRMTTALPAPLLDELRRRTSVTVVGGPVNGTDRRSRDADEEGLEGAVGFDEFVLCSVFAGPEG